MAISGEQDWNNSKPSANDGDHSETDTTTWHFAPVETANNTSETKNFSFFGDAADADADKASADVPDMHMTDTNAAPDLGTRSGAIDTDTVSDMPSDTTDDDNTDSSEPQDLGGTTEFFTFEPPKKDDNRTSFPEIKLADNDKASAADPTTDTIHIGAVDAANAVNPASTADATDATTFMPSTVDETAADTTAIDNTAANAGDAAGISNADDSAAAATTMHIVGLSQHASGGEDDEPPESQHNLYRDSRKTIIAVITVAVVAVIAIVLGLSIHHFRTTTSHNAAYAACVQAATNLRDYQNKVNDELQQAQTAASFTAEDIGDQTAYDDLHNSMEALKSIEDIPTCDASMSDAELNDIEARTQAAVNAVSQNTMTMRKAALKVEQLASSHSVTLAKQVLAAKINEAKQLQAQSDFNSADDNTRDALQQAIDDAQRRLDTQAADESATQPYTDALNALQQAIDAVRNSIETNAAAAAAQSQGTDSDSDSSSTINTDKSQTRRPSSSSSPTTQYQSGGDDNTENTNAPEPTTPATPEPSETPATPATPEPTTPATPEPSETPATPDTPTAPETASVFAE